LPRLPSPPLQRSRADRSLAVTRSSALVGAWVAGVALRPVGPLAADVVELALSTDAPVDLGGPLGQVLALARPRLIVVCSAPVSPTSRAALAAADPAYRAADDEAAASLGATILRTDSAGAIALSGGADGWTLGG
jgi:hypothetical protein